MSNSLANHYHQLCAIGNYGIFFFLIKSFQVSSKLHWHVADLDAKIRIRFQIHMEVDCEITLNYKQTNSYEKFSCHYVFTMIKHWLSRIKLDNYFVNHLFPFQNIQIRNYKSLYNFPFFCFSLSNQNLDEKVSRKFVSLSKQPKVVLRINKIKNF